MRPGLVLRHYYSEPQLIIFHSFSKTRSIIFSTLNPDPSRSDPDDSETRVRLLQQLLLQSETRSLLSPVGSVQLICLLYLKKKKKIAVMQLCAGLALSDHSLHGVGHVLLPPVSGAHRWYSKWMDKRDAMVQEHASGLKHSWMYMLCIRQLSRQASLIVGLI